MGTLKSGLRYVDTPPGLSLLLQCMVSYYVVPLFYMIIITQV